MLSKGDVVVTVQMEDSMGMESLYGLLGEVDKPEKDEYGRIGVLVDRYRNGKLDRRWYRPCELRKIGPKDPGGIS